MLRRRGLLKGQEGHRKLAEGIAGNRRQHDRSGKSPKEGKEQSMTGSEIIRADSSIRVTVWNEFRKERTRQEVKSIYPDGIHQAIAKGLEAIGGFPVRTAVLDEPDHGLNDEVLNNTDVLTWWGHMAHAEVKDEVVKKIHSRVLAGMGFIALHSSHISKIFLSLMGTSGCLKWREVGEKERVWNIEPGHPIAQGIGDYIEIPNSEMYGERFDIPSPDKLVFISWFEGGEVFRSGCCWERGHGRIFYFSPGHEAYPIYHNREVIKIIANACRWAAPRIVCPQQSPNHKPLESIRGLKK